MSWIVYFKVWLKLPIGPSVCTPVMFTEIVLVLSTARKVLKPIPYPASTGRFFTAYFLCYKYGFIKRLSYLAVYGMSLGKLPGGHLKREDKSVVVFL